MTAMLLGAFLSAEIEKLRAAGIDNPSLDVRLLAAHALGMDRAQLLSQSQREVSDEEISLISALLARRCNRESVARIIGTREFWGLPFALNEATLEPRPDSETLIETVLAAVDPQAGLSILDLGTGSGCLLLSLLHDLPSAGGLGIDLSPRAVEQATQNAVTLALNDRARFRVGNWLDGVDERFDVILCNPPYIRSADIADLMPEVRDYDPRQALDGGENGLDPYRLLVPNLKHALAPNGLVAFEVGIGQAQDVAIMLHANAFVAITQHQDLSSVDRCVLGRLPS